MRFTTLHQLSAVDTTHVVSITDFARTVWIYFIGSVIGKNIGSQTDRLFFVMFIFMCL